MTVLSQPVEQDQSADVRYNPLAEKTKDRSYTGANVNPEDAPDRVPEATFSAPTLDIEGSEPKPAADAPGRTFNKEYSDLPDKDKKQAAEKMAETAIDAYEFITSKAGAMAKISEKKLNKEFAQGSINPNLQIPIDQFGNTVSVEEYAKEHNSAVDGAFEVDEEFKEKVRPPLTRVLAKRGLGMTDEHQLMYLFGKDLVIKSTIAIGLNSASKEMLKMMREASQHGLGPAPAPIHNGLTSVEDEIAEANDFKKEAQGTNDSYKEATTSKTTENKDAGSDNFIAPHIVPENIIAPGNKAILEHMEKEFPNEPVIKKRNTGGRPPGSTAVKSRRRPTND